MVEWLKSLFVAVFGVHSGIATFLISMIPIIELRGAIPFGASVSLWGENALGLWGSFFISLAGSSIVAIILAFLFWPLFKWLKKTRGFTKLASAIENKLTKKSKNIDKNVENADDLNKKRHIKMLGTFLFVAIPLPLTGVWTGTCLALFLGLSKKDTLLSVLLGNIVAGIIMTLVSYFFAENTMIVFLVFVGLALILICFEVIKSLIKNRKQKNLKIDNIEK